MTRAFAIQFNSRFNLKPAEKFGEVTYLYTDKVPPIVTPQVVVEEVIERLEHFSFDPDKDFVVLSGSTVNVVLFVAAAILAYEKIKLLIYDPKRNVYYEREIRDPE